MKNVRDSDPVAYIRRSDGGRTLRFLIVTAACMAFWMFALWLAGPFILP